MPSSHLAVTSAVGPPIITISPCAKLNEFAECRRPSCNPCDQRVNAAHNQAIDDLLQYMRRLTWVPREGYLGPCWHPPERQPVVIGILP